MTSKCSLVRKLVMSLFFSLLVFFQAGCILEHAYIDLPGLTLGS